MKMRKLKSADVVIGLQVKRPKVDERWWTIRRHTPESAYVLVERADYSEVVPIATLRIPATD